MKKVVLLTGQIGTGRTTLFNKITNSNQKALSGGQSVTREVYIKDSQYGQRFTLIDTPGFGGELDDKIMAQYLNTLENFEISRIMVVARYNRLYIIVDSCKEIIQLFERYKDKITIVITFFDQCKEELEIYKKEIIEEFHKFQIQSVIFASRQDTGETLCKSFDSEIKYSQAQKIKLTETEMLSILKYRDDDGVFWYEYEISKKDLLYSFDSIFKELKRLKVADSQKKNERLINQVIEQSITQFNQFHNLDEQKLYLVYQEFKEFITQQINEILNLGKQNYSSVQKWEENKIILKNYFEDLMRPYNQKFEVGRQKCLQNIWDNAKNQKINYL